MTFAAGVIIGAVLGAILMILWVAIAGPDVDDYRPCGRQHLDDDPTPDVRIVSEYPPLGQTDINALRRAQSRHPSSGPISDLPGGPTDNPGGPQHG